MTFFNLFCLFLFEDSLFALFGTLVDLLLYSHHDTTFGRTLSNQICLGKSFKCLPCLEMLIMTGVIFKLTVCDFIF
jgi:hypothetical protein